MKRSSKEENERFELCIFDLDGTLVNSLRDLADSTNYALAKLGFPTYEVERYRYFVGKGVPKLIENVLPDDKKADRKIRLEMRKFFDEYYNVHYVDYTRPYEGIKELLKELKKKNIKIAVLSNKPDDFVRKIVTALFGDEFDMVLGQRDGLPRKPDPSGVFEICSKFSVKPENCIYFGDSGVDMQTATNSKTYPVGVLWGFRTKDELEENGAKTLIDSPLEIFKKTLI